MRQWLSRPENGPLFAEALSRFDFSEILLRIAIGRGASSLSELYNFFYPRLSRLHSPFFLKGMYDAVSLLRETIESEKKITVFTDSDLDGITGLSVFYSLMKRMGITPHYRFPVGEESYGLSSKIVREISEKGTDLLVTIDSGIKDIEEIKLACSLGMDVIVTDHHEPDEVLPDAIVLNPKLPDSGYPYRNLAGAGVIFKLCHALLMSYLPSFKKMVYLINEESGRYHCRFLRDGVFIKDEVFLPGDDLPETGDGDQLFVAATEPVFSFLRGKFDSPQVIRLSDMINFPPFKNLDNAAEAFSLPRSLYSSGADLLHDCFEEARWRSSGRINDFVNESLGKVAIGSIADIMPLNGENRILTSYGIHSLNGTTHPGLGRLINGSKVDSRAIGWDIAPILNSPGRFGEAELTASFFLGEDVHEVAGIVDRVRDINDHRKQLVQDACRNIILQVEEGIVPNDGDFLFLSCDEIPDGLAGLIANRLADTYSKPVIVATENSEGVKGSGRAPGNIDFLSFISLFEEHFERIGGHSQAFGFTTSREKLQWIIGELRKHELNITDDNPCIYDVELPVGESSLELAKELAVLGPFGRGNENPLFYASGVTVESFSRFGKEGNHGKFIVARRELIGWGIADEMENLFNSSYPMDLLYSLEINHFRGKEKLRLVIRELRESDV